MAFSVPTHFSDEELALLNASEGKRLKSAYHIYWKNVANPDEVISVLDWLQLQFQDGDKITFHAGPESSGLSLVDFEYRIERLKVELQFNEQVMLEEQEVSQSRTWMPAIGRNLTTIDIRKDSYGNGRNNSIKLHFGGHVIEVRIGQEGLLISMPAMVDEELWAVQNMEDDDDDDWQNGDGENDEDEEDWGIWEGDEDEEGSAYGEEAEEGEESFGEDEYRSGSYDD